MSGDINQGLRELMNRLKNKSEIEEEINSVIEQGANINDPIIELGAEYNDGVPEKTYNITPLMAASYYGNSEVVKKLLELGADTKIVDTSQGRTAIDYVFLMDSSDLLQPPQGPGGFARPYFNPKKFNMGHIEVFKLLKERDRDRKVFSERSMIEYIKSIPKNDFCSHCNTISNKSEKKKCMDTCLEDHKKFLEELDRLVKAEEEYHKGEEYHSGGKKKSRRNRNKRSKRRNKRRNKRTRKH